MYKYLYNYVYSCHFVNFNFVPHFFHSTMSKVQSCQCPMQRRKERDECEWTTSAQKSHLLSKQADYIVAWDMKSLKGWFCIEMRIYFNMFPTEPITVRESLYHPDWTPAKKDVFEEKVSWLMLKKTLELTIGERESGHGLKTIPVLQYKRVAEEKRCSS